MVVQDPKPESRVPEKPPVSEPPDLPPSPPKALRIFIRVDSKEGQSCRRIRAFCKIFPGPVPVLFYYKDTKEYEKTDIPTTVLNDFSVDALAKICGAENLVIK